MASIPRIAKELKHFFEEDTVDLARQCGMRNRTIPFATLAMVLILGWWKSPASGPSALARFAGSLNLSIEKQDIDCHFTPRTASWLLALLRRIILVVVCAGPVDIALLRQFTAVLVEDGSTITLPAALKSVWRGCGGGSATSDPDRSTEASVKLTVRLDLLKGTLQGPHLQAGRSHELRSVLREEEMAKGSLWIADLGYWTLKWLYSLNQKGVFFLLRYKAGIVLWRDGKRLDLLMVLPQQVGQEGEMRVDIGEGKQVRQARLLASRVPDAVVEVREQRYFEYMKAHHKPISERVLALMKWTLVVTNVPASMLTAPQAFVLLHARWQIELLFKLWKQDALVDEWTTCKPWRILCEVYAKLIAVVIQHWVLLLSCWDDPHRSLTAVAEVLREQVPLVVQGLCKQVPLQRTLRLMVQCVQGGCSIVQRSTRFSTSRLLQSALDPGLT